MKYLTQSASFRIFKDTYFGTLVCPTTTHIYPQPCAVSGYYTTCNTIFELYGPSFDNPCIRSAAIAHGALVESICRTWEGTPFSTVSVTFVLIALTMILCCMKIQRYGGICSATLRNGCEGEFTAWFRIGFCGQEFCQDHHRITET